jgi:RNA polymerase sigma-70 factor (ECF subfamily)
MSEKADEEIASDVQHGDLESFGVLVERYEPKIARYARKFLFEREDVKDLVQDVFIKAYVNIQSFDPKRRFSPWIYRIAHNEFINALRKKTKSSFTFDLDLVLPHVVAPETADEGAHKKDLKQILGRSLDELSPKYREPLVLFYFEDMDYKEIADILQIPVSTVGVRLARGKAMLEHILKTKNVQDI